MCTWFSWLDGDRLDLMISKVFSNLVGSVLSVAEAGSTYWVFYCGLGCQLHGWCYHQQHSKAASRVKKEFSVFLKETARSNISDNPVNGFFFLPLLTLFPHGRRMKEEHFSCFRNLPVIVEPRREVWKGQVKSHEDEKPCSIMHEASNESYHHFSELVHGSEL